MAVLIWLNLKIIILKIANKYLSVTHLQKNLISFDELRETKQPSSSGVGVVLICSSQCVGAR